MMSVKDDGSVGCGGAGDAAWADILARVIFFEALDPNALPLPPAVRERVCAVLQELEELPALEATTECLRLLSEPQE